MVLKRTHAGTAKILGVSGEFIKLLIADYTSVEKEYLVYSADGFEPLGTYKVREYAEKIPYIELLYAVTHWSIAQLKKEIITQRLEVDSNLTTSKGRKAELFYAEIRGHKILEDYNDSDARHGWDFKDVELGDVNVKSSRETYTKAGDSRWKFSIGEPGTYILIGYKDNYVYPLFVKIYEANEKCSLTIDKLILQGDMLWKRSDLVI